MQILYGFENKKEPMPGNQNLRRIHSITDPIRKSYLFAQAKKQNYGVFWKRGVLGILKNSLTLNSVTNYYEGVKNMKIPAKEFILVHCLTYISQHFYK